MGRVLLLLLAGAFWGFGCSGDSASAGADATVEVADGAVAHDAAVPDAMLHDALAYDAPVDGPPGDAPVDPGDASPADAMDISDAAPSSDCTNPGGPTVALSASRTQVPIGGTTTLTAAIGNCPLAFVTCEWREEISVISTTPAGSCDPLTVTPSVDATYSVTVTHTPSSNQATDSVAIQVLPATCTDGVSNGTETGVDCGNRSLWINELHNFSGSSTVLRVEIAGPAGMSLNGWSILGYSGGGGFIGQAYLDGTLVFPVLGTGFASRDLANTAVGDSGIDPAVALMDPNGNVVQFLNIGSSVTAMDGPAAGLTSEVLPPGEQYFHLVGAGRRYTDFSWVGNDFPNQTDGLLNGGQAINALTCGQCVADEACLDDLDCGDGLFCDSSLCKPTACVDMVQGGNETDVDCGGREVWFNELSGQFNGVELAGALGTSLAGWKLWFYAPSPDVQLLSGKLDALAVNGLGVERVGTLMTDNMGAAYPVALIDPSGTVVDFVSFGAPFTATDGPAMGMTATELAAVPLVPSGSVYLTGVGNRRADFTWTVDRQSLGSLNTFQVIIGQACDGCAQSDDCLTSADCAGDLMCVSATCAAPICGNGMLDVGEADTDCGGAIWLNEYFKTNAGPIQIELAASAGVDLSGWRIDYYYATGANIGELIESRPIQTESTTEQGGLQFVEVFGSAPAGGGGVPIPFAMAIIDASGTVVQFVSPDAPITAIDGGAIGMTAEKIPGLPATGRSVELVGSGRVFSDFAFVENAAPGSSIGRKNAGQDVTTAPNLGALCEPCASGSSCTNDADCAGSLQCVFSVCM